MQATKGLAPGRWGNELRTHEIFAVDGMLVRAAGPLSAPCLLMVHAFACNGADFLPLFNTPLADSYRLIAVDLPGFGSSPSQFQYRTIAEHAAALALLTRHISNSERIGFIAHSVGSMVVVETIRQLKNEAMGVFSIEGNLTSDDAYFSGRAANFEDPIAFKQAFLDDLWKEGNQKSILRTYHANASIADAEAMWFLGCDARRQSVDNASGQAYLSIRPPSLYYWNSVNVPAKTIDWIATSGISNQRFANSSHWPMIDIPGEVAVAIEGFFRNLP